MSLSLSAPFLIFFSDTATTEIYTLSLHDALPISQIRNEPWSNRHPIPRRPPWECWCKGLAPTRNDSRPRSRSEEHTSELQSHSDLVCRLLLEKKKVNREHFAT